VEDLLPVKVIMQNFGEAFSLASFGSHWKIFLENEPWKMAKFFLYCITFHITILHCVVDGITITYIG